MPAVVLQSLKCESCSGPMPWDGMAPVMKCPQCSSPHAIRWNSLDTPVTSPKTAAIEPPRTPLTPQDQLRRLEAAWHRTEAQFFEHHKNAWRGLNKLLLGLALCGSLCLVLAAGPRSNLFPPSAAWLAVCWTFIALLWRSALRRRTAERDQARRIYEERKKHLAAQIAGSVAHN